MVVRGQLLLVYRVRVHSMVGDTITLQRDACVVTAIRDGEDHGTDAGPTGREVEERGVESEASGGVRAWNRDRWA